ncbi:MAG: hypothetical protein WC655_10170, partial [Candidatus Hydrogenedentales bacterium]
MTCPSLIIVDSGQEAMIGSAGGSVDTDQGGGIQVPPGALSEELLFRVADTGDLAIRATLAEEVPYVGSVTVDVEASPTKTVAGEAAFSMIVKIPLATAPAPDTKLDVYRKGDLARQWVLLDFQATVDVAEQTASFRADQPGTYIVRENDEYSIPAINLDDVYLPTKADLPPPVQPLLNKIAGSGPIPIVLIHGLGSYKKPGYARWDNFIDWAWWQRNLDLQNTYQLWWFKHDSDGHPVGFDIDASYKGKKNNAREFAEELQRQRDAGLFPKADDTQFIIVAHSRGGLVARAFMEKWPEGGAQVLTALTLATPHHGSPEAVPDWTYHTIRRNYSLPINVAGLSVNPGQDIMVALSMQFDWRQPGAADLAWDNFDGTSPGMFGVPYHEFQLSTLFAGVLRRDHVLSANDAGWPCTSVDDTDTHLPPEYGRSAGATLWDMTLGTAYTHKLLLYCGYAASQPFNSTSLVENEGLFALSAVMCSFESLNQDVSHFAANDGMVPLQSALFLASSDREQICATASGWWGSTRVKKPLELLDFDSRLRVPSGHVRYREFEGYNHLDMVVGRRSNLASEDNAVLFQYIAADLALSVASMPIAHFAISAQNDLYLAIDASASHDRSTSLWPSTTLEYRVNWGSSWSEWSSQPALRHTYSSEGTYTIRVQARDQDGMISVAASQQIAIIADEEVPIIASVNPSTPVATGSAQAFTITGTGFAQNATVNLHNTTTGNNFPNRVVSSRSGSTGITINPNFGTETSDWSVTVYNGSTASNTYPFQVEAVASVTPSVSLSPSKSTYYVGESVNENGAGFTPSGGYICEFTKNGVVVAQPTGTVNASGTWTIPYTFPAGSAGSMTFRAQDTVSGLWSNTVSYTVASVTPSVSLSPSKSTYYVGESVNENGAGFTPSGGYICEFKK